MCEKTPLTAFFSAPLIPRWCLDLALEGYSSHKQCKSMEGDFSHENAVTGVSYDRLVLSPMH